jgi:hypothetical protein
MRVLITGLDEDGRSCVVDEVAFEPSSGGGLQQKVFEVAVDPPPARPSAPGHHLALDVPLGMLHWLLVQWAPNFEYPTMHYTDTMDFHCVVTGSIALLLDDGPHELRQGDGVVVAGVVHAWKVGPEGCMTSSHVLATPPRAGEPTPT